MDCPTFTEQLQQGARQDSPVSRKDAGLWAERDRVEDQSQQCSNEEGASVASCALRLILRRSASQNTAALRGKSIARRLACASPHLITAKTPAKTGLRPGRGNA